MTFPQFIFSSDTPSITKDKDAVPVGASSASAVGDQYYHHEHFLKWIQETKKKIPRATPKLRKEAFEADPLLKGTVFPYLKNVLLQGFKIETDDNKLYSQAIKEITQYLEDINLMQVFREDFLDFAILTGHAYRRMDPDVNGNVTWLESIEPSSITAFKDPWNSSIIFYRQKALVCESFTDNGIRTEHTSWFIPFGNNIKDIYSTYVQTRETGNDLKVSELFETYKTKYKIADITNLRIAAAERIIPMHNSGRLPTSNSYYDDDLDDNYNYSPAPIDSVLLSIWLKRLLLVNAPHLIYIVINPFLHARSGILKEGKDALGNPTLVSSVPPKPASALQAANPELYSNMLANFNAWVDSMKDARKNIMDCVKNGGVFSSGPDVEIRPIESSRNPSYLFIRSLIDQLNEEIGQAFGFPMSLVLATGTELASSRNILQIFNTVHAGERTEYEKVANQLIKKMFEGRTWTGTIEEDGKKVTKQYKLDDANVRFELETPDTKDLKAEAETFKLKAEGLVQIKTLGASKEDMQALCEEADLGLLGLDNFAAPVSPEEDVPAGNGATEEQIKAILPVLKSIVFDVGVEQGLFSAGPTDPSGFEDAKIKKLLEETYQTAKEDIDHLFEEE
jgi:hypothetical protein